MLDSLGGLAAGAALGLAIVWVAGAVLLQIPGQAKLRTEVQQSLILQRLNTIAPPRTVLRAFARVDPFPQIAGPAPPSVPPDKRVLSSAAVVRARPSVVRIKLRLDGGQARDIQVGGSVVPVLEGVLTLPS